MSDTSCALFERNPCSACNPSIPLTPLSLVNRPGLPAIVYRVGTFSAFRQAMLDYIALNPVESTNPEDAFPIVRRLRTLDSDDYAIAMLELWACVCDVVTLYQQASANEMFLRTATLRESLARIGALLGYEPGRGVAATAVQAFLADLGAAVTVPPGFRTQSVPPPAMRSAVFETSVKLGINDRANMPKLVGTPYDAYFGFSGELLKPYADALGLAPGMKLVFYDQKNLGHVFGEENIVAVAPTTLGQLVTWRGDPGRLAAGDVSVARFNRKFGWFGSNAPATYLRGDPDGKDPTKINWTLVPMTHDGTAVVKPTVNDGSTNTFSLSGQAQPAVVVLDAVYDNISVGSNVLVYYEESSDPNALSTFAVVATVQGVSKGASVCGQLSGTCTILTIDKGLGRLNDLRNVVIYELVAEVPFLAKGYNNPIFVQSTTVYVDDASGMQAGQSLVLASVDAQGPFGDIGKVVSTTTERPAAIVIDTPLRHQYSASATTLYGNVTTATHGETQKEQVLGDGDASQAWQEFKLSINPVTYVPDPASDDGASSTLQVFVDGFEWTEVPTFYGRGPLERIFVTRVDDTGSMWVCFGDGDTGALLTSGVGNVRAHSRKGLGVAGNVGAGAITILSDSLPGVQGVVNPFPALGGAEPESAGAIRANAPSTVVTLGRAVSLRDYEALALTYKGVAKSRASWGDFGDRRGVLLTVAGAGGQPLDQLAPFLSAFLDDHRDPNVPLSMCEYTKVLFGLAAVVHVLPGWKQSVVKAGVAAAVGPSDAGTGYLDFAQLEFGQSIFQSAILQQLQAVPGVDWVELTVFSPWDSSQGYTLEQTPDEFIDIDPSSLVGLEKVEAVVVGPTQIAWPTMDDSDIVTPFVDITFAGGVVDTGSAS